MIDIILANYGLWFNILLLIGIGAYLMITQTGKYIFREFALQIAISALILFGTFSLFFYTTTDLMDTEQWNGKVERFEYYEEWRELVHYTEQRCSGGKHRTCHTVQKTRIDYHAPYYQLHTNLGETVSIDRKNFLLAQSNFGSDEVDMYRSGQVSFGDGDKYVSYPSVVIPTSVSHQYENYVVAAKDNILNKKVSEKQMEMYKSKNLILAYPKTSASAYGDIAFDRVVSNVISQDLEKKFQTQLDQLATAYGSSKQVNPMIYITRADQKLFYAIQQDWKLGKNNDAVLVLGVDASNKIVWSNCLAWSKNKMFNTICKREFVGKKLDDPFLIPSFGANIKENYQRKTMKEFEYLKENITIDWKWQFLIFALNAVASFFTFRFFLQNGESYISSDRFNLSSKNKKL